jgi:hypothetical protein
VVQAEKRARGDIIIITREREREMGRETEEEGPLRGLVEAQLKVEFPISPTSQQNSQPAAAATVPGNICNPQSSSSIQPALSSALPSYLSSYSFCS